ncbi:MAG: FHA domain-containing protein [Sandaracinus sp.]|nr:FHA domain-containing protein [Myxococcales bacterium]MCB9599657.1 FHA domain-containing protein [Sandaracinus sp.]MCB9612194.1 FHA domain-containing protein [Sandaracinus sp.]MCB9618382.1 FHA domain-containing protein [Sandaracinus sp.]MCB9623069.1 FHA domain-containing protein [Sandaracinus sp.]
MARFRLRYGATDLEMPQGDFVIGRSSSCNLALDDGLVSRRHALLRVDGSGVTVEDLGSRNGVQVNGKTIAGPTSIKHLDRVTIGHQELVLLERSAPTAAQTLQIERCWACGALNEPGAARCGQCGARLGQEHQTLAGGSISLGSIPELASSEEEATTTTPAISILAPIAEKSLALGRHEEASRLAGPVLDRLLESLSSTRPPEPAAFERAIGLALKLSEGPSSARWLTWLFDAHARGDRMMSAATIDRLHELVRKTRFTNPKPIREYLERLRARALSPAEKFLMRRLESLERVVSA